MPTVNGDVTQRAGSQDFIDWQLLQSDGSTAIDLTNATKATLRLKNTDTGDTKAFATDDVSPKFFITTAADGKVELRPATTDFASAGEWEFYVDYVDANGIHSVPEHKNYTMRIIEKIT